MNIILDSLSIGLWKDMKDTRWDGYRTHHRLILDRTFDPKSDGENTNTKQHEEMRLLWHGLREIPG